MKRFCAYETPVNTALAVYRDLLAVGDATYRLTGDIDEVGNAIKAASRSHNAANGEGSAQDEFEPGTEQAGKATAPG